MALTKQAGSGMLSLVHLCTTSFSSISFRLLLVHQENCHLLSCLADLR